MVQNCTAFQFLSLAFPFPFMTTLFPFFDKQQYVIFRGGAMASHKDTHLGRRRRRRRRRAAAAAAALRGAGSIRCGQRWVPHDVNESSLYSRMSAQI